MLISSSLGDVLTFISALLELKTTGSINGRRNRIRKALGIEEPDEIPAAPEDVPEDVPEEPLDIPEDEHPWKSTL